MSIFAVLREWVQGHKRVELCWTTDGCKALRWGVEIGHTLRLEPMVGRCRLTLSNPR